MVLSHILGPIKYQLVPELKCPCYFFLFFVKLRLFGFLKHHYLNAFFDCMGPRTISDPSGGGTKTKRIAGVSRGGGVSYNQRERIQRSKYRKQIFIRQRIWRGRRICAYRFSILSHGFHKLFVSLLQAFVIETTTTATTTTTTKTTTATTTTTTPTTSTTKTTQRQQQEEDKEHY